jgi:TM2 domain
MDEMLHCAKCGHMMHESARACPQCGAPNCVQQWSEVSDSSRLIALLLCAVLGVAGVHRFYVGKVGTGLLWMFTGGLLGVGMIIDLVAIASGDFRDIDGYRVTDWQLD